MEKDIVRWEALEYTPSPKGSDWYWALGIVGIAAAATAIILGNLLFAILILVGSFTLALYRARTPRLLQFELNNAGLVVGARLYPYKTLESFWIVFAEKGHTLLVTSDRALIPQISIPLPGGVAEDAHVLLSEHLREEEQHESFSEKILETFGF